MLAIESPVDMLAQNTSLWAGQMYFKAGNTHGFSKECMQAGM